MLLPCPHQIVTGSKKVRVRVGPDLHTLRRSRVPWPSLQKTGGNEGSCLNLGAEEDSGPGAASRTVQTAGGPWKAVLVDPGLS